MGCGHLCSSRLPLLVRDHAPSIPNTRDKIFAPPLEQARICQSTLPSAEKFLRATRSSFHDSPPFDHFFAYAAWYSLSSPGRYIPERVAAG